MKRKPLILVLALFSLGCGAVLPLSADPFFEDPPENVKAIFAKSCSGCHKGKYPPKGLSWEPKRIAAAVDAFSQEVPSLKIINTSDPQNSYLLKKVRGTKGITGQSMPPGKPLTSEEIGVLSAWIMSLKK